MSEETPGDPQSKHSVPDELRGQPPEAAAPPERREARPSQPPPAPPAPPPPEGWQFPGADPAAAYPTPPPAPPARAFDPEVTAIVPRGVARDPETFANREAREPAREPYRAAPEGNSSGAFQQAPSAPPWGSPAAAMRPDADPAAGRSDAPPYGPHGGGYPFDTAAPAGAPQAAAPAPVVGLGASLSRELRQERFTTAVKPQPRSGWRRALLRSTFGLINPGESKTERIDREYAEQIAANIPRTELVFAVVSPRGGVSKTTTTAAIGSVLAEIRGAEVVVIDADPNDGNLASRVNPDAQHTFADMLRDRSIGGVNDIRNYTKRNAAQLDVLAGSRELVRPAVYDKATLLNTVNVLRNGYRIIGIDCGQNLGDELFSAVLNIATAMIVVTGDQFDSAASALTHYDRLQALGRTELRDRSFLLISDRSPKPNRKLRAEIMQSVSTTVWRDPAHVPFDPHLAEATVIDLDQLNKKTYRAYLAAAARLSQWYGLPPIPLPKPPRR